MIEMNVLMIKLKYISLGVCSWILHFYIIAKPKHILSGMTRFQVKNAYEGFKLVKESLQEQKTKFESKLMLSLIEFDNAIQLHFLKYGDVIGVPVPHFSKAVNMLWREITNTFVNGSNKDDEDELTNN